MDWSLEDLFGVGAAQTASTLTISKAGLFGLSPSLDNAAESVVAALLNQLIDQCRGSLVDEIGDPLIDEIGEPVIYDHIDQASRLAGFHWRNQISQGFVVHRVVFHLRGNPAISGFDPNHYA